MRPVGDTSKPEDICLECMAEGASDSAKYRREQYGIYEVLSLVQRLILLMVDLTHEHSIFLGVCFSNSLLLLFIPSN